MSDLAVTCPRLALVPRLILFGALLFHCSFLVSWRTGFWNRFTFDSTATQGWRGWDFFAVYQAGHNVLTGVSAYESDNECIEVVAPRYTPFRYLPAMAYTLGAALNALPPLWAVRLWVIVTEIVWLWCAYRSWRSGRDRNQGAILAAMWLFFTPYYLEIYLGQFSAVQSALILTMLDAASAPLGWRYDLAWIVSLLWKQNTGLLAPLFVRQRRWTALGLAALAVSATSTPYFALYPEALSSFLSNFRSGPPAANLGNLGARQALYSVVSALLPGLAPSTHQKLQILWVISLVVVNLWLTFRCRLDPTLHIALWVTSYFLVYHQVWEHHYVMLLPILVTLYRRTSSCWVIALYVLIAIWTPYILVDPTGIAAYHAPMRWTALEPRGLDVLYHPSKAAPTLLLWAYIARAIGRARLAPQEAECSPR